MLDEVCREIKNWFAVKQMFGDFTVENGSIEIDGIQTNQYFRIVGSVFNDGIYKYPATNLQDEVFHGAVWALAIPKEIIDLSDEIDAWKDKYAKVDSAAMSPFASESFGGYSYSKPVDGSSNGATSWQGAFASRLNRWRKI